LLLMYLEQGVVKVCVPPGDFFLIIPLVIASRQGKPSVFGNEALAKDESWELTWLKRGSTQKELFRALFEFVVQQPVVLKNAENCRELLLAFEPVLVPSSSDTEGYLETLSAFSIFYNFPIKSRSRSIDYLSLFERGEIGVRYGLHVAGDYTRLRRCRNVNAFSQYRNYVKVGFDTIVNLFIKLLCEKGYDFTATKDRLFCQRLVMDYCYVALDFEKELERIENLDGPLHEITLEDGTVLELGKECIIAPEVLFHPGLVGIDEAGIMSLFQKYDVAVLSALPLILSGGCAIGLNGLSERIQREIVNDENIDLKLEITKSNIQEDSVRWFEWLTKTP